MKERTNKRKMIALCLILVMTVTTICYSGDSAKAQEKEVILISTAEELGKIGVEDGFPSDGRYKLTEDIDHVQTSIGNMSTAFRGEFDGDGHSVTLDIVTEENYKGLFGSISNAVIENVVVRGTIQTQYGWAAGIAAKAVNSQITNCGSEVNIQSTGNNSTCFAGIAGYAENCIIRNCYNTGSIEGKIKNAAGIAGQTKTTVTIENCYNTGNITTSATSTPRVGGIAGYGAVSSGNEAIVANCYNAGTITGTSQTGSFMGYIYTGFSVTNCYCLEGSHENIVGFNYEANIDNVTIVNTEQLKSLGDTLGDAYITREDKNSGFPILSWQNNTDKEDLALLEELRLQLPSGVLQPKYYTDKNLITYVENLIESKEAFAGKGIKVSIKEVENRMGDTDTYIAQDGTIHYFYRNLFEETPYRYMGQADVIFELSLNRVSVEYSPRCVNIYWDLEKIENDLQTVAEEYDCDAILGENTSADAVTQDFSLPKYPEINHNGKKKQVKWVSAKYTSSNPEVVSISDNAAWDSTFTNMYYEVKVLPKEIEEDVTITATFEFERYTLNSNEDTISQTIQKEIPIKVPASDKEEAERESLREKLANYEQYLTDFNDGTALDTNNVTGDIQLAIPSRLGLDGKYYKIQVDSSDSSLMEINGYRTYTYRPLPGQDAKKVVLTVTVSRKDNTDVSAQTQISLNIVPLTKEEIDGAVRFMETAKQQFFHLIKNQNTEEGNIVSDLQPFYGIYQDEAGNVYAASYIDRPNNGGILCREVNPQEPIPDNMRYWISSNPSIISDQNLKVTVPEYDTKVTVGTVLSHEVYENYAKRYAEDEVYGPVFQKLVDQKVCVEVLVRGIKGKEPETEKVTVPSPEAVTKTQNVETTETKKEVTTTGINSESKPKENKISTELKVKKVKVTRKKKSLKVQWKKNKKSDGYQVSYTKSKKWKKAKNKLIKSSKKTSVVLHNLKKQKVYYVRVRAYRIVNRKREYGKWSKIKRVKIK